MMKKLFTTLGIAMAFIAGANTASAQQELVVDGTKGYDGVLVQGTDYVLPGTDETWYAMPEFFTHKEGNVWTFNAYPYAEYAYFFELNEGLKWINVNYRQVDDPGAAWANWDLNKAIYVNGGDIGFPSWQTNMLNWDAVNGWAGWNSVAVPQVAADKYRLTLVVGEQINGSNVNFKFYGQRPYDENIFASANKGGILVLEDNPWLRLNGTEPEETNDNGNFFLKDGVELADGDTLVVNFDMATLPGKVVVEYHEQAVAGIPTLNGVEMVKHGNNFAYEGDFAQGGEFTLANIDLVDGDLATLYVDPVVAAKVADGKYKFNAISGSYTALLIPELNYLKIFPGTYAEPGTYANDKALWIIGSNIGQPSAEANNSGWSTSLQKCIPVAQISSNVYQVSLTVGQEITSDVNFKLFGQCGWGMEFTHDHVVMPTNDYLYVNEPESFIGYDDEGNPEIQRGGDDGNILARGALGNGDKLVLTIDLNGLEEPYIDEGTYDIVTHPGTITVQYEAYAGPVPTLNGTPMTAIGANYFSNVELTQGGTVTLTDPEGFDFDTAYTDPFFLENNGGGKFTFKALSGSYAIIIDKANNYIRAIPGTYEQPATISEGGLWIMGEGIGRPSVNGNAPGWNTGVMVCIPVAQVEKDLFKLQVTAGKEIWDNFCNFKFFGQANWGIEFKSADNNDGYSLVSVNQYLGVGDGTEGHDPGNIYFFGGDDGVFVNDETYIITLDFTESYNPGKLLVEKVEEPSIITTIGLASSSFASDTFTLQGIRVSAPSKGIYIQNGRKVVR